MTAKPALDDLEAVRAVVTALADFDAADQERILRWTREKLGLPMEVGNSSGPATRATNPSPTETAQPASASTHSTNIKTFVTAKNPKSDSQFAATVAFFYKFEAAEGERRPSISSTDLQDACRKVGRERLTTPSKTLLNAHAQGYLDKAGERGTYTLNTVGENLVAMALPETNSSGRASRK
ncbi:hypothetical protein NLM27_14475 [Bradyrhizobium sp. CCGB12]|uniref:hypothetical protein n=1 Tax=Bradyrhizobium sp. CCGB12 TaxID=2949632 RepID=UPI0020B1A0B4|nr:hypothetical protein [Bradyrhizobium sp. CCGB12]MCP3389981.1 hypothetical protein [Bradyrhizobium sp. CCGB12]